MPLLSDPNKPAAPAEWTKDLLTDRNQSLFDQIIEFDGFDRSMFPSPPEEQKSGALTVKLDTKDWQLHQVQAMDSAQRVLTTVLGMGTGIPLVAEQFNNQMDYLSMIPGIESVSPIVDAFEDGWRQHGARIDQVLDVVYDMANGEALDALQGAISLATDIVGAVPLVGWIGRAINGAVSLGRVLAAEFEGGNWSSLAVPDPGYSPENDFAACQQIQSTLRGRNWNGLFLPMSPDQQFATFFTMVPGLGGGATDLPHFRGFRGKPSDDFIYGFWNADLRLSNNPDYWGFVPTFGAAGMGRGGALWRGMMGSKNTAPSKFRSVGNMLPTAQALGAQAWNTARNPYAPQCMFVDARLVHDTWLRNLVYLRRGLHWTHERDAYRTLKDANESRSYGEGFTQARLWLNMSRIERGDLKKRKALRKKMCNAMAQIFGWPQWGPADEELVGEWGDVVSVSDDEYIERFKLYECAPVRAANDLYQRQRFAMQTVTAAYATGQEPAFAADPELRKLWEESLYNIASSPNRLAAVDPDLVPIASIRELVVNAQLYSYDLPDAVAVSQWIQPGETWTGNGPAPDTVPSDVPLTPGKAEWTGGSRRRSGGGAGMGLAIAAVAAWGLTQMR